MPNQNPGQKNPHNDEQRRNPSHEDKSKEKQGDRDPNRERERRERDNQNQRNLIQHLQIQTLLDENFALRTDLSNLHELFFLQF